MTAMDLVEQIDTLSPLEKIRVLYAVEELDYPAEGKPHSTADVDRINTTRLKKYLEKPDAVSDIDVVMKDLYQRGHRAKTS